MIRKFATACVLPSLVLVAMLTAAAAVHAQQTPAPPPEQPTQSEQTQSQTSSSQEAAPEQIDRPVKKKVKGYEKWTFNVGGGASLTNGTTKTFVRGGGGVAAVGGLVGDRQDPPLRTGPIVGGASRP